MTGIEIVKALVVGVMEWKLVERGQTTEAEYYAKGHRITLNLAEATNCCDRDASFWPLTNYADACMILDHIAETHHWFLTSISGPNVSKDTWQVQCEFSKFGDHPTTMVRESDFCRAVCVGALKAKGLYTE